MTTNRLLNLLPPEDLEVFMASMERVLLPVRSVLQEPGQEIDYIYFLENGLGSVVAVSGSKEIEVAHFGIEAMTGLEVLHGTKISSHEVLIQIEGESLRIKREAFLDVLHECPCARALFQRYHEAFVVQVEQTALANGRFSLEARLARWLLMCQDRVGDSILITHEFLALMLGVRRAGVTTALHVLEGDHAVASTRGQVVIKDRAKLKQTAGDSYGTAEAAYQRLLSEPSAGGGVTGNERASVH